MSKIVCAYCERSISVNQDGRVRKHGKCFGSDRPEAGFQRAPSHNDVLDRRLLAVERYRAAVNDDIVRHQHDGRFSEIRPDDFIADSSPEVSRHS